MIDELLDYLFKAVPTERAELYRDTTELLCQIDPVTMDLILETFASTAEQFDTASNVNAFHSLMVNNVCDQIEQFGVYLDDRADYFPALPGLSAILSALYRVEHYDNPAEFKVILDEGNTARYTLGEILNAIDPRVTADTLTQLVQDVSPSLVARIAEVVNDRVQFHFDDTATFPEDKRKRAQDAVAFYQTAGLVRYFEEGGKLGEPFGHYVDYFYYDLQEAEPAGVARILLTLGTFAGLSNEETDQALEQTLASIFADLPADRLLAQARALKTQPRLGA